MRRRIAQAKAPDGPLDAKIGAGRLQDVELTGQLIALGAGFSGRGTMDQIEAGVAAGALNAADGAALMAAARLCWSVQAEHKTWAHWRCNWTPSVERLRA